MCPSTCWAEEWADTYHLTLDTMSCTGPKASTLRWIFSSLGAAPAFSPCRETHLPMSTYAPNHLYFLHRINFHAFVYSTHSKTLTDYIRATSNHNNNDNDNNKIFIFVHRHCSYLKAHIYIYVPFHCKLIRL